MLPCRYVGAAALGDLSSTLENMLQGIPADVAVALVIVSVENYPGETIIVYSTGVPSASII